MSFDADHFRRVLSELTWVADVVAVESTGSTNDDALALAAGGAPEGTVVVAGWQSAGRGRLGRSWISEPGAGILASWIVRPDWPAERWPLLGHAAALACASAVTDAGVRVGVKWPNDLLVGERKIAGILADARPVDAAVVGLGLNVRGRVPPELASTATSLEAEGAGAADPAGLLAAVLERFAHLRRDPDVVLGAYREACVTLGARVRVERPAGSVEGLAAGIDAAGALIVETDTGAVRIPTGDVVHLRRA